MNNLTNGMHIDEISSGDWVIIGGMVDIISGGSQHLRGNSTIGNAVITGGVQYFCGNSTAGEAKISGGVQHFWDDSTVGNAVISGGIQHFWDNSTAGEAKISGGIQDFRGNSTAGEAKITGEKCQKCKRRFLSVWSVSDMLWESVTGIHNGSGIFCQICFEKMAGQKSLKIHWAGSVSR